MIKAIRGKERRSFSKIEREWDIQIPNLLDVQLESFRNFIQADVEPLKRKNEGLQEVFNSVFPISDAREYFSLEFVRFDLGEPKYSVDECQERDLTFSVPLKATLRLRVREDTEEGRKDKSIIEQEVYLGELPIITDKGTFIINGAERVIVSQLHRSPGVFFDDQIHPNGKKLFTARIIPYRGSWVEFSLDVNDIMYVHIDRKRKLPVTVLLKALGYVTDREILELFYDTEEEEIGGARSKREPDAVGKIAAEDVVDERTGEVLLEANEVITMERVEGLRKAGFATVKTFVIPHRDEADIVRNTLKKDSTKTEDEALTRIYNLLRPGEPPRADTARDILKKLFFNPKRYDLAKVGRYKLNRKLPHEILLGSKEKRKRLTLTPPDDEQTTLCPEDFIVIIAYLIDLRLGAEVPGLPVTTDDIDHLGNRRVRAVGELLSNQFNVGLARMARIIRERMTLQDAEQVTPYDLINARTISAVIHSCFDSSQLSQFMDQTNPLAELTHKRRSRRWDRARLTRDRAGEVGDVHSHALRAHVPDRDAGRPEHRPHFLARDLRSRERLGFLETPYRRAANGVMDKKQVQFLSADVEDRFKIAQANALVDDNGHLVGEQNVREKGEFPMVEPKDVDYMDISPIQLVSPAAALIPFLEHDDANRALMGSNMQRQAVPLLFTEAPLVGTGLEGKVAEDSGALIWRAGGRGGACRGGCHPRSLRLSRIQAQDGRLLGEGGGRFLQADQVQEIESGHVHQPASSGVRG